ncbi:MAG: N-acetylmuramoyl-L-alanine amidase [Candidatus Pacearchaeota archaeon]|nr:N-acetylmuramoyl-L-alanine amidase [Candidatus Pacearchaeota archaeon]MDE1848426.1 N-acetylmuramoyl-L-alanine amidase [Nanoarchaeota archaeon]
MDKKMYGYFRNKKGADKVLAVYWFLILFIVTGAIIYLASQFYSSPIDVRGLESKLLANQVLNCIAPANYLSASIFSADFKNNFLQNCHITFNTEDAYDWKSQQQYYLDAEVYRFDSNTPGLIGSLVFNVSAGNPNIKTAWELMQPAKSIISLGQRNVDTIVIHTTEGDSVGSAVQTISSEGLSIHYMIDRNGNIISYNNENSLIPSQYQNAFVPESTVAQHAGCVFPNGNSPPMCSGSCLDSNGLLDSGCQALTNPSSSLCCIQGFNQKSIGIELVNLGDQCGSDAYKNSDYCKNAVSADGKEWEGFSQAQMNALVTLVSDIAARDNIPLDRSHIIGHYQITNGKTDPGPAFNWDAFMKALQIRGAVQSALSSSSSQSQSWQSAYVLDSSGNQYVVRVLALVGKTEKNQVA